MMDYNQGERYKAPKDFNSKLAIFGVVISIFIFFALIMVALGLFYYQRAREGNLFNNNDPITREELPQDLDYRSVEELYDYIRENYDGEIDYDQVIIGIKKGLVESLSDPNSVYYDSDEAFIFNSDLEDQFSGIGAEITDEDGLLIVVTPLSGYPASQFLKPRDIILAIDGQSTLNMDLYEAIALIRGEPGTSVKLKVRRDSDDLEFDIVRQDIKLSSVTHRIEDGIGIIRINKFSSLSGAHVLLAAQEFKQAGVKGVVLDLRSNPGGFLPSTAEIGSVWLSDQEVITEIKVQVSGEVIEVIKGSSAEPILAGIEMVVLIDGGSASASEILAGALKQHDKAVLVGETTFGKGSVQDVRNDLSFIGEGEIIKITEAHWFLPNGENIHGRGIDPDIEVVNQGEDDNQLQRALEILKEE